MKKYRYYTVNFLENLTDIILVVIASGNYVCISVPDFTRVAVRRYLRDLGYLE